MKYVESLFHELLEKSSKEGSSKEDEESDSKQEEDDGLLEITSLLDALPETMPVALASYLDDAETKTKINLEELYGYFDACKREKGDVIEEIISNSVDVDAKEGEVVDEKTDDVSEGKEADAVASK